MSKKLEVTQNEAGVLLNCVADQLVAQRKHVRAQEEPSERAYEILDTLQELRGRLSNLVYPQRNSRF